MIVTYSCCLKQYVTNAKTTKEAMRVTDAAHDADCKR